jgi:hypothetical protein
MYFFVGLPGLGLCCACHRREVWRKTPGWVPIGESKALPVPRPAKTLLFMRVLKAVFFLRVIDDNIPDLIYKKYDQALKVKYPEILDEAIDKLIADLLLKDKVEIAGMNEYELEILHPSLGLYIRENYGLWHGGSWLESCRELTGIKYLKADEAPLFIIKKLWEKLQATQWIRKV